MKSKLFTNIVLLSIITIFLLISCEKSDTSGGTSTAAKLTLKWGETQPESHPSVQMAINAAKEITEKTDGRVTIQVFAGGQIGGSREMVEATSLGAQDIVTEGVAQFQMLRPLEILEAPYIWKNSQTFEKVVSGPIVEEFSEELIKTGNMRILGTTYYGVRQLTTTSKPVNTLSDMKGFKLRVPEVDMYMSMAEAWGANPTPMNFNELYLALKQNVVNGQENPLPTINSGKFYEVQKYLVLTSHIITARVIVINEDIWQKISPDDQKIMSDTIEKYIKLHNKEIQDLEKSLITQFEKSGMTVITPDVAAFRKAVLDVVPQKLEERWGKGLFQKILDAQK